MSFNINLKKIPPMGHSLDFSKDANIKANICVVNNDDNEGN
jgi:hypothetical protein